MSLSSEIGNEFVFIWKIEDLNLYVPNSRQVISSPRFGINTSDKVKWCLLLNPELGNCFLYRVKNDEGPEEIKISFKGKVIVPGFDDLESEVVKSHAYGKNHSVLLMNIKHLSQSIITIQCCMWNESPDNLRTTRCLATSNFQALKCSFPWNVCRPSAVAQQCRSFNYPDICSYKISLVGVKQDTVTFTILETENADGSSHSLKSKISIVDSAGFERVSKWLVHLFEKSDDILEFQLSLKDSGLLDENGVLENDLLQLHCEFTISNKTIYSKIYEYQLKWNNVGDASNMNGGPFEEMGEDFHHMYTSKKMSDVTFQIGEKTLAAHKFVLTARSPVFTAMFAHDLEENKSGVVEIQDLDYATLDAMLRFMYGGGLVDITHDSAMKLLIAADKYQVLSLKKQCSSILNRSLSTETVCDVLLISDMVQDTLLKSCAFAFFKTETKTILRSPLWKKVLEENIRLATEVLTMYAMDPGC